MGQLEKLVGHGGVCVVVPLDHWVHTVELTAQQLQSQTQSLSRGPFRVNPDETGQDRSGESLEAITLTSSGKQGLYQSLIQPKDGKV